MELFVYAVYLVGMLAALSALIVRVIAALPTEVLMRGAHAGMFAEFGAAEMTKLSPEPRMTTIDVPRARAA
jgi:hypothetical protein